MKFRKKSNDDLNLSDHARLDVAASVRSNDRRDLMKKENSGYSRASMPAVKFKSTTDSLRSIKAARRDSMCDGIKVLDSILETEKAANLPSLQPAQIETLVSLRNSLRKIENGEDEIAEEEDEGGIKLSTRSYMKKNHSVINRKCVSESMDGLFSDGDSSSTDSDDSFIVNPRTLSAPPNMHQNIPAAPPPLVPSSSGTFRYGRKPETGVNVLFAFGATVTPSPRVRKKLLGPLMSSRRISHSVMQSGKNSIRLQKLAYRRPSSLLAKVQSHAPKEWYEIREKNDRIKLAELLSWDNLRRWDFDIFEVDKLTRGNTLLFVGWAILSSPYSQHVMEEVLLSRNQRRPVPFDLMDGYRFIDHLNIDQKKMTNFLRSIEKDYYHENPYHNNIHAADVLQTLHSMLQEMGGVKKLQPSPIQLFSVLLSAVIHDVGHPGFNNFFQQSSQSDIALCYNDQSCLENMHLALAFRKLVGGKKKSSIDIFGGMSREEIATCRKQMIGAVLGTDMSKHFQSVNDVKRRIAEMKDTNNGSSPPPTPIDEETTIEILHYMMHAADISNGAKQKHIAVNWADRCLEEFFRQGDREKELSLPVSPLCDRDTVSRPESQKGFIEFIIKPTFEVLVEVLPLIGKKIIPVLDTNLAFWNSQIPKTVVDNMEQLLDDFEKNDGVLADDETASVPMTESKQGCNTFSGDNSVSSLDMGEFAEEVSEELTKEESEELKASMEFIEQSYRENRTGDLNEVAEEGNQCNLTEESGKLSFGSLSFSDEEKVSKDPDKDGKNNSDWSSTLNAEDDEEYDSEMEYEC